MRKLTFAAIMVLLVVASCTKKAAPTASKEPTIDGAPVYAQNCARCHGANGTGDRAPDLTGGGRSKADIMETVSNGAGRMPAFTGKLSDKEIEAVAVYVLHLSK